MALSLCSCRVRFAGRRHHTGQGHDTVDLSTRKCAPCLRCSSRIPRSHLAVHRSLRAGARLCQRSPGDLDRWWRASSMPDPSVTEKQRQRCLRGAATVATPDRQLRHQRGAGHCHHRYPHTPFSTVRARRQREAIRYGVGVGREGFTWSRTLRGTPQAGMAGPGVRRLFSIIARQPYPAHSWPTAPGRPLSAGAMYQGSSVYRIHGTN